MQIVNVFVLKNQSLFIARRGRGGGVAKALVRMQRNEGMGGGSQSSSTSREDYAEMIANSLQGRGW